MDQDRWNAVNRIFHAALEVSSSERPTFIRSATAGDPELQAEVERLLKADEVAGSYLESPVFSAKLLTNAPALNPGDVLCGRFRIVRLVAEGGMGYVFEAIDSELTVNVALKIIRPEIASNLEALARFRQEVRLARRITHPNVCRTFDIERETLVDPMSGRKHELVFLTMEFLQGETLGSRLRRAGALPLLEALHIARQVADALGAAHALGIVHRDMKPANIMLVPTESPDCFRAVITDFGLARPDPIISFDSLSALSHTARPIGTLAYMAPEQLEAAPICTTTDLYAFGLILFEMVTGTRAFPSADFLTGIARRLNGLPPSLEALMPGLPTSWSTAIEGCLRHQPSERFQSAADVMAVLDGDRLQIYRPTANIAVRPSAYSSWPLWQRIAAFSIILFAAVSLLVVSLRIYQSRGDSGVPAGAVVYLTDVKNETSEKYLDNLTELIRAELSQSAQINLLDQGHVGDTLQRMAKIPDTTIDQPMAREIAMRAGAARVVFVTVAGSGGSYHIDVDIQKTDSTPNRYREHWTRSFPWHSSGTTTRAGNIPAELLEVIRSSAEWIRREVGESASDIARLNVPPQDVTTGNWEALADYTYAEMMGSHQKREEAVTALRSAIHEDPEFALAYARLGDLLVNLNRQEDGYRAYLKALESSDNSRLSIRERDRIKGIYAQDTGDYQASEDAFREYTMYYEHDYLGWFYRGRPLAMLGRTGEAIQVLKRAYNVDPKQSYAPIMLVRYCLLSGDLAQARYWQNVLNNMQDSDASLRSAGVIAFIDQDYAAARNAFQSLSRSQEALYRQLGARFLVDLLAERGNNRMSWDQLNDAIAENPTDSSLFLDRAYIAGMNGDFAGMADDLELAMRMQPSPDTSLFASQILGQVLGKATGQEAKRLERILASLEPRLPAESFGAVSVIARFRIHGEILLARGDAAGALRQFRKADKLESPLVGRDSLARALEAQALGERNSVSARRLLEQSLTAYSVIALHPAVVWQSPIAFPPGFYVQQLERWLRVAKLLGKNDHEFEIARLALLKLRAPAS